MRLSDLKERLPAMRDSARALGAAVTALSVTLLTLTKDGIEGARRAKWPVILWDIVTMICVAPVYWLVNAQGLRMQMPIFATKLHKIPLPGFSRLRLYEGLHTLDCAHLFCLFLLFTVWWMWIIAVKAMLYGFDFRNTKMNTKVYMWFILVIVIVITLGDGAIFYAGLADRIDQMWSAPNPVVPVIATAVYMAVLAFISLMHVQLKARYES